MIRRKIATPIMLVSLAGLVALMIHRGEEPSPQAEAATVLRAAEADPFAIALADYGGEKRIDREIEALQKRIRRAPDHTMYMDRLGWAFVSKGRQTCDPGWNKIAEQCAAAIESRRPGDIGALLLRGHIHEAQHEFAEAEAIARRITTERAWSPAFALLGDALMEQGRLEEAIAAYQRMIDLKPALESYSRVAHMRWLTGDLEGALEMMRTAVSAGTPRDPEPLAWAFSRLAMYQLQAGELEAASASASAALEVLPDHAASLLAQGRIRLAASDAAGAIAPLTAAAAANPLPEYLWTLADALRAAGDEERAVEAEAQMARQGAANDPRTYALYLATRGVESATALALAQRELETRSDAHTHDALAWALLAAGRPAEAGEQSRLALAPGMRDARLFYHAGVIAAANAQPAEALAWLEKARAASSMLLPSEQAGLERALAALAPTPDASLSTRNQQQQKQQKVTST